MAKKKKSLVGWTHKCQLNFGGDYRIKGYRNHFALYPRKFLVPKKCDHFCYICPVVKVRITI